MKKKFEIEVEFKGHKLYVDGYAYVIGISFYHIYLSGTDIEISDSLTLNQHDELSELILKLI